MPAQARQSPVLSRVARRSRSLTPLLRPRSTAWTGRSPVAAMRPPLRQGGALPPFSGAAEAGEAAGDAAWVPHGLAMGLPPGSGAASSSAFAGEEAASKPWFLGRPQLPESGWERVLELFRKDELNRYPEETVNICKAAFTASIIGLVYGGIPGFTYAKKRFIEQSDAEMYFNRLDAVQSAHRAAIRGFIRYGWRWSWRVAAFVTIFNTVSISLSAYRDKSSLSHFVAAGAVTGGLFRFHLGLGGFAAGSIFGALLGVPAGGLVMAVQNLSGETFLERRKRERRELYEQQLIEWNTRLSITESISRETDDYIQGETENIDDEKIQKSVNLAPDSES